MKIPVFCSHDEIVDIDKLVPNPRNPNTHPDNQIELLAKIIKTNGWRNPIVVSTRSGFITKGHGRLDAAQKLGVSVVPVDYQDYKNEAEEWQDMIADNRIAELAEMDTAKEQEILDELMAAGEDLELCGIIESLEYQLPDDNKDIDEAALSETENECPKCGFKW